MEDLIRLGAYKSGPIPKRSGLLPSLSSKPAFCHKAVATKRRAEGFADTYRMNTLISSIDGPAA